MAVPPLFQGYFLKSIIIFPSKTKYAVILDAPWGFVNLAETFWMILCSIVTIHGDF